MAALFGCFRKQRNRESHDLNNRENNKKKSDKSKCKCDVAQKVLQCVHCKSALVGYWERGDETTDGGASSYFGKTVRNCDSTRRAFCPCKDSHSQDSSEGTPNTPTSTAPSTIENGISNPAMDYRPMANADMPGMSYNFVSKDDPNYNMSHARRGKALVFNFNKFDSNTFVRSLELSSRRGSDKDQDDIVNCLKRLSFEVHTYENLKRQEFDKVMETVQNENHSDADCIVICVMSHGLHNSFYTSDGSTIPVQSVWEEFESNKCPTLAGKPKIFIIQACRGFRYDNGTQMLHSVNNTPVAPRNDVTDSASFSYVIPNAADVFVAFSCPLGFYSWRDPELGSWFIQSICKIFKEHAYNGMELKALFTEVSREVALNYESSTDSIHSDKKKQVPSTTSTLIRHVVFKPKPNVSILNEAQTRTPVINNLPFPPQPPVINNGDTFNGNQISLQQVQIAVAEAQTITNPAMGADIELPESMNTEIPPLVSVTDHASSEVVPASDDNESNEDLASDEDPSVVTPPEKRILPKN